MNTNEDELIDISSLDGDNHSPSDNENQLEPLKNENQLEPLKNENQLDALKNENRELRIELDHVLEERREIIERLNMLEEARVPDRELAAPAMYDNSHALEEMLREMELDRDREKQQLLEELDSIKRDRDRAVCDLEQVKENKNNKENNKENNNNNNNKNKNTTNLTGDSEEWTEEEDYTEDSSLVGVDVGLEGAPVIFDRQISRIKHEMIRHNPVMVDHVQNSVQNSMQNSVRGSDHSDISIKNSDENIVINGWTQENEETVKKWQTDIEKSAFVYGEILLNNSKNMERVLVLTLVISTLMTLLSALAVTLGPLDFKWVVLAFDIVILFGSSIVAVMSGLIKIYGWDETIKKLTRFVQKLDSNWFVFETELSMAPVHRTNADDFLQRADGQYMYLMQQCPPISGEDYSEANRKYKERLFDDYMWSQKFKKRFQSELEEIRVE